VIAANPLLVGAVKATVAEVADGVIALMVGMPGAKSSDDVPTRNGLLLPDDPTAT
jgi:hypothetical protein